MLLHSHNDVTTSDSDRTTTFSISKTLRLEKKYIWEFFLSERSTFIAHRTHRIFGGRIEEQEPTVGNLNKTKCGTSNTKRKNTYFSRLLRVFFGLLHFEFGTSHKEHRFRHIILNSVH